MKLFNEDDTYTNEAIDIAEEFIKFVEPFLVRHGRAHPIRQLSHLLQLTLVEMEGLVILDRKEKP